MNCPECKHELMAHGGTGCWYQFSFGNQCTCQKARTTILNEADAEIARLQAKLQAAQQVIREFVFPNSVMIPAQKEAWKQWSLLPLEQWLSTQEQWPSPPGEYETQGEHEQHNPYRTP